MKRGSKPRREEPDHVFLRLAQLPHLPPRCCPFCSKSQNCLLFSSNESGKIFKKKKTILFQPLSNTTRNLAFIIIGKSTSADLDAADRQRCRDTQDLVPQKISGKFWCSFWIVINKLKSPILLFFLAAFWI